VGIFSTYPLEYFGGGERFAIRLAGVLKGRGFRPTLLADSAWGGDSRLSSAELSNLLQVGYERVPYRNPGELPILRSLFTRLPTPELFANFDVNLVFANRLPPPTYMMRLEAIQSPVCMLFHGIDLSGLKGGNSLAAAVRLYWKIGFLLTAPAYRKAGVSMQVLTPEAMQIASRMGFPRAFIDVIPNAIDNAPFRVGRNDERFDVVFIGRLVDSQKGTRLLAKVIEVLASKRLPGLGVSIIGSGPGAADLKSKVRGIEFARLLGHVSDEQKYDLLSQGNLMLLTSPMDPSPVSVLEGLAAGLPSVCTYSGGSKFMLSRDNSFGDLVRPVPEEIVERIGRYWEFWRNDPSTYYETKLRRRERMITHFSLPRMYEEYTNLVSSLLGRAR
jgi:glycosyltransferase involved in cell wall biosynthesis